MSKPKVRRLVNMELDPADRHRRRQSGSIGSTPPAQMDHATSPRAKRLTRDGQRWLAAQERPYIAPFETGEPWRGSAEREWDDSRD